LEILDDSILDITDEITMSAWIYPTDYSHSGGGSYPTVISKATTNYRWFISDGNDRIWSRFVGFSDLGSTSTIPLNTWTHIILTFDGNGFTWYLNGAEDASDSQSGSLTENSSDWVIGDWDENGARGFKGKIDDVRIYNYALTEEQIKQVYNDGAAVRFTD
jgi:MSHA biogenesis protein MshQ